MRNISTRIENVSVIFQKSLFIVLLTTLLSWSSQAQTVVYIDPTFTGSQGGTLSNPYASLPNLGSNTTYLIKGGTTLYLSKSVMFNVDNMKIGSYGTGRANIENSAVDRCFNFTGNNITIQDLNIKSPQATGANPINIRLGATWGRVTIKNCSTDGGLQGIGINNYYHAMGTAIITGCTIANTQRDGLYLDDLDTVIFTNNTVTNVNLNYANDYGGDCLQTESVKYIFIDSSSFTHNTPGKFCLINNGYKVVRVTNSVFQGSTNESCIYTGGSNDLSMSYYVTNCILKGGMRNLWNNADYLYVTNSVLDGASIAGLQGGEPSGAMKLTNITFVNQVSAVSVPVLATVTNCLFNKTNTKLNVGFPTLTLTNCDFVTDPKFAANYKIMDATLISKNIGAFLGTLAVPPVIALPTLSTFNVTGGGSGCAGSGVAVGLSGSSVGVTYKLYRGATIVGTPVTGTGAAISFGNQTVAGTYTVVASNQTATANMTGSVNIVFNLLPVIFNISGGGVYASGAGLTVSLSSSETGVNYQLKSGATNVGSSIAGTGAALNFNNQTSAGVYTIVATNAATTCSVAMSGSATISSGTTPNSTYVLSDPTITPGQTAVITQNGSEVGVSYQMQVASTGANISNAVNGTGSAIQFSCVPPSTTTYQVVAKNITTNSSSTITDKAVVTVTTVSNLPKSTYTLSDPTICSGKNATIVQSGSETGVTYQLKEASTDVNVGNAIVGAGGTISYSVGALSTANYKVVATNASGSVALADLSSVTVNGLPNSPGMPSGTSTINIPTSQTYTYSINAVSNADNYTWSLSPAGVGTITANGDKADVVWSGSYSGNAYIMVLASNLCGTSSSLQALKVTMSKSSTNINTGVPSLLSGNDIWNSDLFDKNPNAEVTIFDLNGRLISKFKGSEVEMNVFSNKNVTGLYLYLIDLKDGSDPLKGKFVIMK